MTALALLAAALPVRYWSALSSLPIRRVAALAGLLTASAGFALAIGGFMSYSTRVMEATGRLQLEIAERQVARQLPETAEVAASPMGVAMLSPLAFLLTPIGLLSGYMVLTGFVRALTCFVDDPIGDPVLTAVDAIPRRVIGRLRTRHAARTRERAEGPEVPDRLFPGEWAGLKDADFVVVSARRKPDWEPGTFVLTSDKWYVVGVPFDQQTPGGLRTIYPLTEQTTGEVLRKGVRYELPPLQRRRNSSISTAANSAIAPPRSSPPDTAGRFR
jgi:hypothetical protein